MEILDQNKILLFIFFVTPGFVFLRLYEIFFPSEKSASQQVINLVSHSVINYALLSVPIVLFLNSIYKDDQFYLMLFGSFCIFIFPALLAIFVKCMRQTQFLQNHMPHPVDSSWNYYFSRREQCYLVVLLKDGSKVAGFFGGNSFASNTPGPIHLYVEKEWLLNDDGSFDREVNGSKGFLLLSTDIIKLEFFEA